MRVNEKKQNNRSTRSNALRVAGRYMVRLATREARESVLREMKKSADVYSYNSSRSAYNQLEVDAQC